MIKYTLTITFHVFVKQFHTIYGHCFFNVSKFSCQDSTAFYLQLEAELERMTSVRAQKDLILLYREHKFEQPAGTVEWLNARGWISAHHHVREEFWFFTLVNCRLFIAVTCFFLN